MNIRKKIDEVRSFLNKTTSEEKLLNKLLDSIEILEKARTSKINYFSEEDDKFLGSLSDVTVHLKSFIELQEELAYAIDADHFSDLYKRLNYIKNRFDGLAVNKRVDKEIRELIEKWPTIEQREKNKRHTEINSRICNLERNAPECRQGHHMVIREGPNGYFWGCNTFPGCWSTKMLSRQDFDYLSDGKEIIRKSTNNNLIDNHEEKKLTVSNYSGYLSTTALAKKHKINPKVLYDYLVKIDWTEKRGDERKLKKLGVENGGRYKNLWGKKILNEKDSWIVWPVDLLKNPVFSELLSKKSPKFKEHQEKESADLGKDEKKKIIKINADLYQKLLKFTGKRNIRIVDFIEEAIESSMIQNKLQKTQTSDEIGKKAVNSTQTTYKITISKK